MDLAGSIQRRHRSPATTRTFGCCAGPTQFNVRNGPRSTWDRYRVDGNGDGRRHAVVITALQADHYAGTNHEAGRAMDIGAVDGEICTSGRTVRELAAVEGPLRSTELIDCWGPAGPADSRGFGRSDHFDHIHWGMDA